MMINVSKSTADMAADGGSGGRASLHSYAGPFAYIRPRYRDLDIAVTTRRRVNSDSRG